MQYMLLYITAEKEKEENKKSSPTTEVEVKGSTPIFKGGTMNFTPKQIAALSGGKDVTVLVDIEQPPEGYELNSNIMDEITEADKEHLLWTAKYAWFQGKKGHKNYGQNLGIKLPYPKGTTVEVPSEEWAVSIPDINKPVVEIRSKSGYTVAVPSSTKFTFREGYGEHCLDWQPASTMPESLIMRPTVVRCEVKRVQSITNPELMKLYPGIEKAISLIGTYPKRVKSNFNNTHGPGAWELNEYVCIINLTP